MAQVDAKRSKSYLTEKRPTATAITSGGTIELKHFML
jgi:hypothetical protein